MKQKTLMLITAVFVSACATSGNAVKDYNLMNVFYSDAGHAKVAGIIADMSKSCDSGTLTVLHSDMANIHKSTVDLKAKHAGMYMMHVEIEDVPNGKSKTSVYHYMNTSVTKAMASQVELWANGVSRECVKGF